jgi:hypothetical protein
MIRKYGALPAVLAGMLLAGVLPGRALGSDDSHVQAAVNEASTVASRSEAHYAVQGQVQAAATGKCGVRVDYPHPSDTTPHQIHTRAESFCFLVPIESNRLSAVSYRSRWFGWQKQGSQSGGPNPGNLRVTVAANCESGTRYRWRTEGRGGAVIGGRLYTAAAYEQNDSEITCT